VLEFFLGFRFLTENCWSNKNLLS